MLGATTSKRTGHREEQKRRGDLVAHVIQMFRDCFLTAFLAMTNG
jgi:hypothetical protein